MISLLNKKFLNVEIYLWILFFISSLTFVFFPQIDLFISSLFYDGSGFPIKGSLFESIFYYSIKPVVITATLSVIALFFYNLFKKKELFGLNKRVFIYLILVLGIAPGLVVNGMLKDNWGRARPNQVIEFGGDKKFTPAFIKSDQEGYSFSSGHAAAAFSFMGFALLAKNRRKMWLSLAIAYGVLMSIARVSAGGHFFSDVVTSFFIVYIATHIFYKLIIKE